MEQEKRQVELVVISDVHLGTYGCHAKELNKYLKSINPSTLVINGDFIDFWQFSKWYWPNSHTKVLKRVLNLVTHGTKVYYLTGNHDENLRRFSPVKMGNIQVVDKLVLKLDGKKAWFFHGDVFDVTMKHSKWLAKLGGKGYDILIVINRVANWVALKLGRNKLSLSKKIKNSVKSAVSFISDFEETAINIAREKKYKYVVCGHIHQPVIRQEEGVTYLNSGDWVENLTALEYNEGEWSIFHYPHEGFDQDDHEEIDSNLPANATLMEQLLK